MDSIVKQQELDVRVYLYIWGAFCNRLRHIHIGSYN
jgi:hypothetical protein